MKDYAVLNTCPLFMGIAEKDLMLLLNCLSGKARSYKKGESVIFKGDKPTAVGIVLSGNLHIIKEDYFGNRNIISEVGLSGMFGEAFVCAEAQTVPVTVIANEKSTVLFIDYNKIITTCLSACTFHINLIRNMLRALAQKNLLLVDKLEHISKRTIKEKVWSYLSEQAKQHGSSVIEIPFNRQELADFLSVERSALSAELSKLQDEGIIKFRKNNFQLLDKFLF